VRKSGCNGIYDSNIIVKHIAPSSFIEYWRIRKGRGSGTPQVRYFVDDWNIRKIKIRFALKLLRLIVKTLVIIPVLTHNYSLAKFSKKNTIIDTFLFSYAWIIEQLAMTVGEYQSIQNIIKKENL
jgi:hypothetical protein